MAGTQARLAVLAARQHPATFMPFDVLVADGTDVSAGHGLSAENSWKTCTKDLLRSMPGRLSDDAPGSHRWAAAER
jgi:hypothetical protein